VPPPRARQWEVHSTESLAALAREVRAKSPETASYSSKP